MAIDTKVIHEIRTKLNLYQVIEETYTGRLSRQLYDVEARVAQSGIALDNIDKMLFEYNQLFVDIVDKLKPKSILVIGGGVYTLPSYLTSKYPNTIIDIVEPDEDLDDLAERYFNFRQTKAINIFHDYGLNYLKKNQKPYDLIIIDAYQGQEIPDEIFSKKFAKLASKFVNDNGMLAANVISDLSVNSPLNRMRDIHKKYFQFTKVFQTEHDRIYFYPQNLIYLTSTKPIEFDLRYPALSSASLGL